MVIPLSGLCAKDELQEQTIYGEGGHLVEALRECRLSPDAHRYEIYVKWYGLADVECSWEHADSIKQDVPQLFQAFLDAAPHEKLRSDMATALANPTSGSTDVPSLPRHRTAGRRQHQRAPTTDSDAKFRQTQKSGIIQWHTYNLIRSYSVKKKRLALALTSQVGIKTASQRLNIPRGTLYDWTKQAEAIYGIQGNAMSRSLKDQGWKVIFPAVSDVLAYTKGVRRLEQVSQSLIFIFKYCVFTPLFDMLVLSTAGIIAFMWTIQPEWISTYLEGNEKDALSLERMVQRLAKRNGFSSQKPQAAKKSYQELEETQAEFALSFWSKYEAFRGGGVLNVDEMAILVDMPPLSRGLAEVGRTRRAFWVRTSMPVV
ncbi:unnamed protein product [Phytophthora fragariaefolia]|uniref:Unnamed protein product n=1 Tax=Phytophthora fragariaefolia TaxID=1490495 RepID=A0A9W6U1S8_9STRA|nr:unnamed protein product [Phytophthora fragariaefolia]